MQRAQGIIKATAATLYVGIGFNPDHLTLVNLTDLTAHEFYGDDYTNRYGITRAAAGDWAAAANAAAGIEPYAGGDKMSAASTAYLVENQSDQRAAYDVNSPISTFTIGSSANKTGNFNVEASTTYVGVGSRVTFSGKPDVYYITAMTSNGESANEVTLNASPGATSEVLTVSKIWSKYDYLGAASGVVIPKGFVIGASATVNNTDGDIIKFVAETM